MRPRASPSVLNGRSRVSGKKGRSKPRTPKLGLARSLKLSNVAGEEMFIKAAEPWAAPPFLLRREKSGLCSILFTLG